MRSGVKAEDDSTARAARRIILLSVVELDVLEEKLQFCEAKQQFDLKERIAP